MTGTSAQRGKSETVQLKLPIRVPIHADAPGWPRPWKMYEPGPVRFPSDGDKVARLLPVPWINGSLTDKQDWLTFREDASLAAHRNRLCQVCGEPLGRLMVLGAFGGHSETSGSGAHPRCLLMAVNLCPHFASRDPEAPMAYRYEGDGRGYVPPELTHDRQGWEIEPFMDTNPVDPTAEPLTKAQLEALAKADPMGAGS